MYNILIYSLCLYNTAMYIAQHTSTFKFKDLIYPHSYQLPHRALMKQQQKNLKFSHSQKRLEFKRDSVPFLSFPVSYVSFHLMIRKR